MFKNSGELKYKVKSGFDNIVDEKGSMFIALRKIAWNVDPDSDDDEIDDKYKLDLRKYYNTDTGERMSKGVSFLTDDGPNELVKILLNNGYGDTRECLNSLKNRETFMEDLKYVIEFDNNDNPEEMSNDDILYFISKFNR